jgi:hypothetical protein
MVAIAVARYPRMRIMFVLITWTAVVNSFRFLLPPAKLGPQLTMLIVFVLFAILITFKSWRSASVVTESLP